MKILVLAGTYDGRILAEYLVKQGYEVLVSTLTEYGASLANQNGVMVRFGPFDEDALNSLLLKEAFSGVVDATHPYATNIQKLARTMCSDLNIPYFRWQRPSFIPSDHSFIYWNKNIDEAAANAANLGKRIFLTTGSRLLPRFMKIDVFKEKEIFVRILPVSNILKQCEELGLKPNQIIAAQGPFSQEWNEAVFKQLNIDVVVAKESGKEGGTQEKILACQKLNIPIVLIQRPEPVVDSFTIFEFIKRMEEIL